MNYTVVTWNFGSALGLELEDGRTVVVDCQDEEAIFEDLDIAGTFGMWEDWKGELTQEDRDVIERALEALINK